MPAFASAEPVTEAFRYCLRVRYAECDAQKVVFNARYGDYVDLATTEFIRALGFGEEVIDGRLDYQLVRQTTEWKAPARFDDVLALSVSAARLGTTSFTLAVEFRRRGEDSLLASEPKLAESIRLRNPYIDPISFLQVDLLARWRASGSLDDTLLHALVATVNGVAQGLQNTG